MPFIIPANTLASGSFEVDNSCRFDSASSADLRISDYSGAGTSRKTRTYSMWIKRSELSYAVIFGSSGKDHWVFGADHKIQINIGSGTDSRRITDMLFRDVSAWYHIVFAYDTTQSTAANRFTMWVNGAVATTSIVGGKNEVAEDEEALVFINGDTSTIGSDEDGASYCDCYMAEWVFVDGQKLDADSFGEYDEDSGIWKPIDVSGITLGTNGFYLNFKTASDLGIDAGNDNDFEPTNLAAIDQSTDTCTNNFATMNPLDNFYYNGAFSEGNLKIINGSGREAGATSTIALSSGKWFWEAKPKSNVAPVIGIQSVPSAANTSSSPSMQVNGFGYLKNGKVETSNGSGGSTVLANYASYVADNIIGVALDLDSSQAKIYFYKNGALQGSGVNITSASATTNGHYFVGFGVLGGQDTFEVNFGSPPYSESGGNSDANDFGNFSMSVPSGYFSINTKNLAEYG